MGSVFRGSVPTATCRALSGADCDRPVSPDDADCGIAEHRVQTRNLPPLPYGISSDPVRRPKLTVKDEYFILGSDPITEDGNLDQTIFDANGLTVARAVVEQFCDHHGVEDEVARAELRAFALAALNAGRFRAGPGGRHDAKWQGMRIRLSADGNAILGYSTRHYERMPSEVLAGQRSRFSGGTRRARQGTVFRCEDDRDGEELDDIAIRSMIRSGRARVSGRMVSLYAKRLQAMGDAEILVALRATLAEAAENGRWGTADRGGLTLEHDRRGFIVRVPDGVTVATYTTRDPHRDGDGSPDHP